MRQLITLPIIEYVAIPSAIDAPSLSVPEFVVPHRVMHAAVSATRPAPALEPRQCVFTLWPLPAE